MFVPLFKLTKNMKAAIFKTLRELCFQCDESEFGCFDGSCIMLSKVCDEIDDCDDGSDEKNCNIFVIDPEKYRKEYPPRQAGSKQTSIMIGNNFSTHDIKMLKYVKQ